jgi:hypothetical protein
MQAIQTRFMPCTNTRGSRIKASCERGSITIPYPHELSGNDIHRAAVDALVARFCAEDAEKYGTKVEDNPWRSEYVTGFLADGSGVHVFLPMERGNK